MPADGTLIGKPAVRIDGVAKVTGQANFPSDEPIANPAFAYLVTSSIARGRVRALDLAAAMATPGVLDILTHANVGGLVGVLDGPDHQATTQTLESDRVWHAGQIIAVVVADSFEAAREAAHKVAADYEIETPSASFDSPGAVSEPAGTFLGQTQPHAGDAEAGYAAAAVKIDARYSTPTQHHNAMELFTTTCVWDGPKLTIYEPTQSMYGLRAGVAKQLKIDPAQVRTVARFIGGAFGGKGETTARTAWIAIAARRLNRPVKLVPTRDQGFTIAAYRAETRHHVRLGASRDGKLVAYSHQGWETTSRPSGLNVGGTGVVTRMYACPNVAGAINVVHADRATPGYMRAPPELPYMFALESAMDELAHELGMDPIELRRLNDTQVDPISGAPFSSRLLMPCFDTAAAEFGWAKRNPKPGSMRDGDWLIGWGCASAVYPSMICPAAARLSLTPAGQATIQLAGHEIGTGAYTVMAIMVADGLGLDLGAVKVVMGDSDLPPVPQASGSYGTATTTHLAAKACEEVRARLAAAAVQAEDSPFFKGDPAGLKLAGGRLADAKGASEPLAKAVERVAVGVLEVHVEYLPKGLGPDAMADTYRGKIRVLAATRKDITTYTFGAHLVEVRIHRRTREIRVSRVVSAFTGGTIINPMAAHSQLVGGVIWGLSSALHEATEIDPRTARYVNGNFADYLIPVNADIGDLKVIIVPEHDQRVNPLGVKGIGELGVVGMNAAVANAVFHATGQRIRDLPIRLEKLL